MHPSDRLAFDRAMIAEPVWNRIETARDAVGLPDNTLLHAGPPFVDKRDIARPILNSACVAAIFEGLACGFDEAESMVTSGEIALSPAQNYSVVTPLAAVVSASMPMHAVYDAHRGQVAVFAPINGGNAPAPRLGLRSDTVLQHVRWLNGPFAEVLDNGIAEGIALVPIAAAGLRAGDDCHGRTLGATSVLTSELHSRTRGGISDDRAIEFMNCSPSLFLNLWMAATKCSMKLAEGIEGACLVTAAGGNGQTMGIQVSAIPNRWFTTRATPPRGDTEADVPARRALGAIGDSAVVDAFGLGAMAIHLSPEQESVLGPFMPRDAADRRRALLLAEHVGFGDLDLKFGLSARNVVRLGLGPLIALGILDARGELGRLGAGIYEVPVTPFAEAVSAVTEEKTCG